MARTRRSAGGPIRTRYLPGDEPLFGSGPAPREPAEGDVAVSPVGPAVAPRQAPPEPVPLKPGASVWLGGRLAGIVAVCRTHGGTFITSADDPYDICLDCDLSQARDQAITEAPALKRILGET